jgi:hypothetical protein
MPNLVLSSGGSFCQLWLCFMTYVTGASFKKTVQICKNGIEVRHVLTLKHSGNNMYHLLQH